MVIQDKFSNKAISDWREGKITKKEAVKTLSDIRRGGGGGGSSQATEQARILGEKLRIEAQAKAKAEAEAKLKAQQEAQEKARQEQLAKQTQTALRQSKSTDLNSVRQQSSNRFQEIIKQQEKAKEEFVRKVNLPQSRSQTSNVTINLPKENKYKEFKGETYDARSGTYVSESPTGSQATAYIRPPTPEEKIKIDRANYLGSVKGIATEVPLFFERQIEKIQKLPVIKNIRSSKAVTSARENPNKIFGYDFSEKSGVAEDSFISPKNVKKGFGYLAEATLVSGEVLGRVSERGLNKASVNTTNSFLFKPNPAKITRAGAKDLLTNVYMASAFEPFIRTATYQQSQYADEVVEVIYNGKKVKMALSEARAKGLVVTRTEAIGEFGRMSQDRQVEIIKKAFSDKVYLDSASAKTDIAKAITFMKQSGLSNNQITEILKKIPQAQQLQSSTILQSTSNVAVVKPSITGKTIMSNSQVAVTGAELKGSSLFQAGVSTLNPSNVAQTSWVGTIPSQNEISNQISNQVSKQQTNQVMSMGVALVTNQRTKTNQRTNQIANQQTNQITKQITTPTTISTLLTTLKIPRPQINKNIQIIKPQKPEPIKPQKPTPFKFSGAVKKVKESGKVDKDLFEVFGRRFGQDIKLLETTSKKKAEQTLFSFLKGTLGRSGKITKNDKELSFGELNLFGKEFRPAKRNNKRVVQKAKYSLASSSERAEIQYFKKKKGKSKSLGFF